MDLFLPDPALILTGALAFLRISAIMFALPIIGDAPTPIRTRILLSVATTFGLYGTLPATWIPTLDVDVLTIGVYVIKEIGIGLMIGFVARIAFAGILMAASVVAYQMGFGTSQMFLPDLQANADAFTAFHRVIVMLIFLALGLHHIFFSAIADTFALIPGGAMTLHQGLGSFLIELTAGVFMISLQLAAPVLIALMFTMAALGLIARTVPQMNVFIISFPASFFIGMAVYMATFPFYPAWMRDHFFETQANVLTVIKGMFI